MTPESRARRSIICAKGGIEWAGIDERILIPNLVEDFEQVRRAAFNAGLEEGRRRENEEIASAFELEFVVDPKDPADGESAKVLEGVMRWQGKQMADLIRARLSQKEEKT